MILIRLVLKNAQSFILLVQFCKDMLNLRVQIGSIIRSVVVDVGFFRFVPQRDE